MARINSKVYFTTMASRFNGRRVTTTNSKSLLFNRNRHLTSVTMDDLPYGYIVCQHGNYGGFLCVNGIKGLKYVAGNSDNLSKDKLYISYGKYKPNKDRFDVVVFGNEILVALYGARKYSGYDISYIYKRIRKKFDEFDRDIKCKDFVKNFHRIYNNLEQYYDDRIMMTWRRANKFPEKENTVFNYPGDNLFFGDVEGSREKRTKEDLHKEWLKCQVPYYKLKSKAEI